MTQAGAETRGPAIANPAEPVGAPRLGRNAGEGLAHTLRSVLGSKTGPGCNSLPIPYLVESLQYCKPLRNHSLKYTEESLNGFSLFTEV